MLSINTNLSSLIAQSSMKTSTNKLNQAIERMTTGFKINHASDNAANYSISTNMTTKICAYNIAEDNAAMGLDLISTAEGTLTQIQDKLERLRALQEQASNGTYGEQSLNAINAEANALVDEINRLYNTAEYNGLKLFRGTNEITSNNISMQTFSLIRTTSESNGFIQQINQRDTASMPSFASVNENEELVDGTYSISTSEELVKLSIMVFNGFISEGDEFVLANDIDLNSECVQIGSVDNYFTGTFDGNGFVIKNWYSDYVECLSNVALFRFIDSEGTIKNLGIENASYGTLVEADYSAFLAGLSEGLIDNCYVNNASIADSVSCIAALVGENYGTVLNSYADCDFTESTSSRMYGIAGLVYSNSGLIRNCFANSNYSSPTATSINIYPLVGVNQGEIISSYATVNADETASVTIQGITNSDDWDGTTFTLYQPSSSASGGGSGGGTGGETPDTPDTPATPPTVTPPTFTPPTYAPDTIVLQIGASSDWGSQVGVSTKFTLTGVDDLRMIGLDLTTDYLTMLDDMLVVVAEKQTHFGAVSNRLESVLEEITIQRDNLVSSRSTIRDADIAEVSSHYIQQQILQQASATLLATANQSPSLALQLI